MKKSFLALLMGLLLVLAGCTYCNSSPGKSPEPADSQADTQASAKEYYGDWLITSSIGTSDVYALSKQEINHFIGDSFTYSSTCFEAEDVDETVSAYHEETMSADEFTEQFGTSLSDLGVEASEIKNVTLGIQGNDIGSYFFVKDNSTIIVYHNGVFFEATRQ